MEPDKSTVKKGDDRPRRSRAIRKPPMLGAEVEEAMCQRWRDHHDISAVRQMMQSSRYLVVEAATSYRIDGLATEELIGEGYVGLMHAVCQFDPDVGAQFSTYAMWWIRATILESILRNESLVMLRTVALQRQLLFNLQRIRGYLREFHGGFMCATSSRVPIDREPVSTTQAVSSPSGLIMTTSFGSITG